MTDSQKDLVLHLLQKGSVADAVAAYCEETGEDEDSGKQFVKQLAKENGMGQSGKWWLLAGTLAVVGSALFAIFY